MESSATRPRGRGFVALYGALAILVMFAFASFAVDWGRVQLTRTELQRAADAAARAGASQLINGVTAVQTAVVTFSGDNQADGTPVVVDPAQDLDFGTWDSVARTFTVLTGAARSSANAVRVTAPRTAARGNAIPLVFGAILGAQTCDTSATATAIAATTVLDYTSGFAATTTMALNGSAVMNGSAIRLTTNNYSQSGSTWNTTKVPIGAFYTTFNFRLTSAASDGFTFTIQNNATTTTGQNAGRLGYGGIALSMAIKFDLYSNSGEGANSTGLYLGGANPNNIGSFDTLSAGINLHSGNVMKVTLVYDGTTLTQTITDLTTSATFTHTYAVDIPTAVGAQTAYVGFTGGTGGSYALQDIQTWKFTSSGALTIVK